MEFKLTVGELKACLEGYDNDLIVSVAPDKEVTADIGTGVIFAEDGIIIVGRNPDYPKMPQYKHIRCM